MSAQMQPAKCLLTSVLPQGRGWVVMLKFYGDESVDPKTSFMNVSGFLMTEEQFLALDEAVGQARGSMPYFHMKENHQFLHPDVYERLRKLTSKSSVICGVSASMFLRDHKAETSIKRSGRPLSYWMGKPYTYLLGMVMGTCARFITEHYPGNELVAYMFENGHANQGDATSFWSQLSQRKHAELKQHYRYASHTFIDGKGPLGSVCQLADMFAWHLNKNGPQEEVARMFNVQLTHLHHNPEHIRESIKLGYSAWDVELARREARTKRLHGKQSVNPVTAPSA